MKQIHKNFLFVVLAGVVLLSGCSLLQPPKVFKTPPPALMTATPAAPAALPQAKTGKGVSRPAVPRRLPLPRYEKLTYDMRWIGIPVGTITAEIQGIKQYEGREVYVFHLQGRSNAWLSAFYKIDSSFTSYMDVQNMDTLLEEDNRKEGHYRKHVIIKYDQKNHVAHWHSFTDGSSKTFPIPPKVVDGLSSVYYFRTLRLKPGDRIHFPVVVGGKVYQFYANVVRQMDIGAGHFGRQQAVLIAPYAYLNGEKVKKGTMTGYFSTEKMHVPLYSSIKTPLFTRATATLADMRYGPEVKERRK